MHTYQDPRLISRAVTAYFRYTKGVVDQPASDGVTVVEVGGKQYVTIANAHRMLAVYRVRGSGKLKRLVRPPALLLTSS